MCSMIRGKLNENNEQQKKKTMDTLIRYLSDSLA